ncbi:hypothetical protein [Oceaniovalibus guishaninsula]|uniref:hypothetical protein n=1 Tax=Oceaniovalibus guishaninsula TaxID=1046117 RepID=UPI0012EA8CC1|nr:hypothetical protein [Oceaniovalibus guishaninsula]
MADTSSLKISERLVAAIVNILAERGVRRSSLSYKELGLEPEEIDGPLFLDAMIWLSDEGIIRSSAKTRFDMDGNAYYFTLTAYGYRLLGQKFQGALNLGQAVRETAETGRSFAGIGDFVGGLLGGFTKSISS